MKRTRVLLAGIAAVLLLQAPAWSHTGEQIKEYGTAILDGVISPGEYECLPNEFTAGQITYTFRFCHTNDENNDYYAFQVDDLTDSFFDAFYLMFDNEHDGNLAESVALQCPGGEPLEDSIGYVDGEADDFVYCRVGLSTLIPGSLGDFVNNVTGVRSFTPGVGATFELSHPLDSGDSDDYSLSIPDRVGFCVYYVDGDNPSSGLATPSITFPKNCWFVVASSGSQQGYGDIVKISQLQEMIEKLRELAQAWVRARFPDFPNPPCLRCPYGLLTQLSRSQALVEDAQSLPVTSRARRNYLRQAGKRIATFRRAVLRRGEEIDRALGEGAADEMLESLDGIVRDLNGFIAPTGPGEIPDGVPGDGRDDGAIIIPGRG